MTTICESILAVDSRIGYAMVVSEKGEVLESIMRGTRLMPQQDIATFTGIWTIVIKGICSQMEKFLGQHQYYSLGYDTLTVHGLPIAGNKTLVITARKDLPLETVLSLARIAD